MPVNLNQRQQQILWATIRHYIATAEPVGSKTLVDEYKLNVSSATIRNGFASLEKAGLLYQPYTSAGRIPSDSGYRIYVDQLITPTPELGKQLDILFTEQLNWDSWSIEALIRGAAEILATLSGYITMITLPQTQNLYIKYIQLIQVEPTQVMLIVVMDSYATQSVLINLPTGKKEEDIDRELQILSNFLNHKMRGKSLEELSKLNWDELHQETAISDQVQLADYTEFLPGLLKSIQSRLNTHNSAQIVIRGVPELLRQPEFSELNQVKTILQLLELEQELIWQLICEIPPEQGLNNNSNNSKISIRIGAENPLEPMQTCALISSTYQQNSMPIGSIGVLGPKRMLYENAIALVEAAADYLSEAINQHRLA